MDPQDLEFINDSLDRDVELREKIKEEVGELDRKTRSMVGLLNKIHSTPQDKIPPLVDSVRPGLQDLQTTTTAIYELIPPDQFWRWKEMWSNSMRNAVFCATLMEYLTSGTLMSLASASAALGIREEWKNRFTLPAEDYLHGLITLVNELSRLAVNAVTLGNYEEPIRISKFVKDLFAGFSMLNLKNDTLRRRFDSLKYDIKKIEEVVYDVSLRKLAHPA
ncbi:Translin [Gloeophyllum trabeum ATCC 11539]|uniref:Translin n=1 Tax=Gloeophyllum trabeum (strain ATCC 11539 / FP-39264 / Madison 617) TaxID=670483 RepID=S7Q4Q6_GLOTA|nr:Translin [Gloeophyllum trabeum ATCC 11539]EPQ54488.1 Translin [Gloeophyllum trabeum ATCC 11539]